MPPKFDINQYCPSLLFDGQCRNAGSCSGLSHDVHSLCDLCPALCFSKETSKQHRSLPKHQKRVHKIDPSEFICTVCKATVPRLSWIQHCNDQAGHAKALPQIVGTSQIHCLSCRVDLTAKQWRRHHKVGRHIKLQLLALYRAQYEQAIASQDIVYVSDAGGVNFGLIPLEAAANARQSHIILTPGIAGLVIQSVSVTMAGLREVQSTHFSVAEGHHGKTIEMSKPYAIPVLFSAQQRGKFDAVLNITLKSTSTGHSLHSFSRKLTATVGDAADHELLKASTEYVKHKRAPWRHGESLVEGERPPALESAPWVRRLPSAPVPKALLDLVSKGSTRAALQQLKREYFRGDLSLQTHANRFANLLWAEEARTIEDLRMYDIRSVLFGKEGRLYTVSVPGLAEKRPSVVVGDIILAQTSTGSGGRTHRGFVHIVRNEDICVSFHPSFDGAARYNVRFEYNRIPIRRQHQALSVPSASPQRLLFPLPSDQGVPNSVSPHQLGSPITTFNPLVDTNAAQLQAVKSITQLKSGAAPFVIFGPPGTGKTITVVESIRQILHVHPNARILACAPSNSAADLIAQRLSVALTPAEMFRCNAIHRMQSSLPDDLRPYSLVHGHHFALPSLQQLNTYKVIVSTCGNASFPYNVGMQTGHFSHIFVDEAGQASEPEVLQAIKLISNDDTRVILSGDPKQLGPVIRSSIARHFGLETSYLERVMEQPVYKSTTAPGRAFVKLVKNFRSHEAILHYPNTQFYGGDLKACADRAVTDAFLGSPQLANPHFPIVFQHISGENEREASSPSYFNILEATETVERIKLLLHDATHRARPQDVAVITPYHAQAKKIRMLLKKSKIEGVTVCSVEQIQGQERPVIFISTVRSSRDLLSYDAKFTLGFVGNPRRFNVAVTRARSLLVVIGDSNVLSIDPVWRGFLNYIHKRGGWSGGVPGWDTNAPVDANFDYAAEIRESAANDMDALLARLAEGLDIEAEANIERPFVEED